MSTLFKEKDARRSASVSSDSEAEPSNDAAPTREQPRSGSKRRGSRRSLTSRSPASRSRSRSRSSHRAGKGEAAPTSHGARSKGKRPRSQGRSSRSWADRVSDDEDAPMDYSEVVFSDSEAEDQPNDKMVEVSEKTKKILQEKCTRRVLNRDRMQIRGHYPLPKVPATRTPQLDSIMKPEASSTTKVTDKQLAKVQTLLLDSLAPLTMLLEAHHRGDESDPKDVVRAVKAAVELIGNANAHMSNLRRVKVIGDINKALLPLVGDDINFVEAPPLLFGTEFAQKGKEMVDQVKAMRSTFTSKPERRPPFFLNGPPGNRGGFSRRYRKGGAQSFRYGRERPYQAGRGTSQNSHKSRTQN